MRELAQRVGVEVWRLRQAWAEIGDGELGLGEELLLARLGLSSPQAHIVLVGAPRKGFVCAPSAPAALIACSSMTRCVIAHSDDVDEAIRAALAAAAIPLITYPHASIDHPVIFTSDEAEAIEVATRCFMS